MSINIGEAIENGFERTLTRSAAYLAGIFFFMNLISQAMSDTIMKQIIASGSLGPEMQSMMAKGFFMTPLATGLSLPVAGLISLVAGLISVVISIGAIRLFLSDETETLPSNYFTDNIGWLMLNVIAGGIVFSVVLMLGFMAFIIPGFFLLASLYFWNFYVIDKEVNFIEGMKSAWNDSKGNRLTVFGLLVIVVIAIGVFNAITGGILGVIGTVIAGAAAGTVLGMIPGAATAVFAIATFTEAYQQLKENSEDRSADKEKEGSEETEDSSSEESEDEEE